MITKKEKEKKKGKIGRSIRMEDDAFFDAYAYAFRFSTLQGYIISWTIVSSYNTSS